MVPGISLQQASKSVKTPKKPLTHLLLLVIGLFLAPMLGGCASNQGRPHSHFERLEIVAVAPEEFSDEVLSKGESVAAGAAGGAVGGLMANTLLSLACGPFFAACFTAGASGMAVAAVAGGALGLAQLSPEEAEPLLEALKDFHTSHNLSEELAASLTGQIPRRKLDGSGDPDARLSLKAKDVGIAAGLTREVSFWVAVEAIFEWDLHRQAARKVSHVYACQTPTEAIDDWLAASGARIEKELIQCVEDLSGQIEEALRKPPPLQSSPDPAVQMATGSG